jgi:hypothetical protein
MNDLTFALNASLHADRSGAKHDAAVLFGHGSAPARIPPMRNGLIRTNVLINPVLRSSHGVVLGCSA